MSIQHELEQQLRAAFRPTHIEVLNESHLHGGAPRDPNRVRETHYKAVIVAESFAGKGQVQRHQMVYKSLGDFMTRIHALGLHTFTPAEWAGRAGVAPASPLCAKAGHQPGAHG
jgi:BolA family transcriptional regulator, general stress-responsive regulator